MNVFEQPKCKAGDEVVKNQLLSLAGIELRRANNSVCDFPNDTTCFPAWEAHGKQNRGRMTTDFGGVQI